MGNRSEHIRTVVGTLLGVFLVALACTGLVFAHARLLRTLPRDKADLTSSPKQIEMWFDELLDREFNRIEVFPVGEVKARNRRNLATGKPQLDPADRTHLIVALAPLPPGEYAAEWQVLSRDGHSVRGRFTFRVRAPAPTN